MDVAASSSKTVLRRFWPLTPVPLKSWITVPSGPRKKICSSETRGCVMSNVTLMSEIVNESEITIVEESTPLSGMLCAVVLA